MRRWADEFLQWKALNTLEQQEPVWTTTDELLATLIERNDMWFRGLAGLLNAKSSSLPKQIRVPRPSDERDSSRDVARAFAMFKKLGGG